jgi:acetyl-CoA carboxylase biotin carboxyl carrier protein
MPAHNQQAMPVQNAAPVAVIDTPVVEENKYITIKSPIIGTFIESQPRQTYVC